MEAWASLKSFRAKDGGDEPPAPGLNGERAYHGEKRSNETHASTTDPDAKLYRKANGQPAKLSYMGHALMENRSGLVVQAMLTQATGTAERDAAIAMLEQHAPGERRLTFAADKAYDVRSFTADLRRMCVTPHIARNDTIDKHGRQRLSSIDGRTTRHPGYAVSQRSRKRIEEAFGWAKTVAGCAKAARAASPSASPSQWQPTI